jgi:hypothetical protein
MREAGPSRRRRAVRAAIATLIGLCFLLVLGWWQWSASLGHRAQTEAAPIKNAASADLSETRVSRGFSGNRPASYPDQAGHDVPDPERTRCAADRRAQLMRHLVQQPAPASPDAAMSMALLRVLAVSGSTDQVAASLTRAQQQWPNHLDLAWMILMHCHAQSGCDRSAALRRVVTLDPHNAATWLNVMAETRSQQDDAAYVRALRRAAATRFYDARLGTVFLHVRPVLAALPLPSSCRSPRLVGELETELGRPATMADFADIEALSLEMATAIPAFSTLFDCRTGSPGLTPGRRADCLSLLGKIATGDTLLERGVALGHLLRLEDDPDRLYMLRERYRRILWLSSQSHRNLQPMPRDYGVRMWSEGEVNLLVELAIERGEWPPPDHWLPDSGERRALIRGR